MRADEHLSSGHLAALLWADGGEEQARANLRQTLSQLRKLFHTAGRDPILLPFDKIVLQSQDVEIGVRSLLADLERLSLADLARIAPFGDGLDVQTPEFETWMATERRIIQSRLVAHLLPRATVARDAERHALDPDRPAP
jgi:DNA-binding SARP family transcriptional activator